MSGSVSSMFFYRIYRGAHGDVRLGKVPGDLLEDGLGSWGDAVGQRWCMGGVCLPRHHVGLAEIIGMSMYDPDPGVIVLLA